MQPGNRQVMLSFSDRLLDFEFTGMWPFGGDNKKVVKAWQSRIIAEAERRLQRALTDAERKLISSRGGFIALEMIEDTVNDLEGEELVEYLNHETNID